MKVFSMKLGPSTMMMFALFLSYLLLSPIQSVSAACSKNWNAGAGTSIWNTPGNWNPSGVPGAGDDVCIFTGANPDPDITSAIATSIKSLTIPNGEQLKITSGSLTVTGNVTINGTLNNQGTLNVGGNFTNNNTYTVQASGTVVMNGSAAQTIGGSATTSFNNLTINNAAGVTLATNPTVNGALTLTNGNLTLGANTLTMGTSATVAGTPSATKMINASSTGVLRKVFNATGSFTYPIGTPGAYSPIAVNITAGSFAGNKNVDARVSPTHEPHVHITGTSYIERHWILAADTISGLSANLTMTYVNTDVVGTGTLVGGFYNTTTGQWIVGTLLAPEATATINNLTALNGNATVGTAAALAVELASFSANLTGGDVLVEWRTLYELNNAGFNLYRSTSADSLGTKINAEMIQSQVPGSGQGGSYQHRDSNIERGMTYFYTLESVDVNGVTTLSGPVSVDTSNITTAVTLEEMGTSSTSQGAALYLLLGSVFFAAAGFILRRRNA